MSRRAIGEYDARVRAGLPQKRIRDFGALEDDGEESDGLGLLASSFGPSLVTSSPLSARIAAPTIARPVAAAPAPTRLPASPSPAPAPAPAPERVSVFAPLRVASASPAAPPPPVRSSAVDLGPMRSTPAAAAVPPPVAMPLRAPTTSRTSPTPSKSPSLVQSFTGGPAAAGESSDSAASSADAAPAAQGTNYDATIAAFKAAEQSVEQSATRTDAGAPVSEAMQLLTRPIHAQRATTPIAELGATEADARAVYQITTSWIAAHWPWLLGAAGAATAGYVAYRVTRRKKGRRR